MDEAQLNDLVMRAEFLLARGSIAQTAQLAHRVLAADPTNADGLRLLTYCALHESRFDDALTLAHRWLAADPDDDRSHHALASTTYYLDEDREALAIAREALRQFPDSEALVGLVVTIALYLDEDTLALSMAQRLVRLNPNDPNHHVQLAQAYLGAGQFRHSQEAVTEALRLDPTHAEALRVQALSVNSMFDARSIDGALSGAALSDPTSDDLETTVQEVVFRFSLLLTVVSLAVGVVVTLSTWGAGDGFALVPAVVSAVLVAAVLGFFGWSAARIGGLRLRRGWQLSHRAQRGVGWRYVHRILIIVGLVTLLCWLAAGLSTSDGARVALLSGGFLTLLAVIGWVAWPDGFDGTDEVDADTPDHLARPARLSFWGLNRAAKREFDRILTADPDDVDAVVEAALVDVAVGDPGTAYRRLSHALTLQPDRADLHLTRAQVLLEEGHPEQAQAAAEQAQALDDEDWQTHLYLALTAVELDDPEQAMVNAGLAVELAPTAGHAHYALGLAQARLGLTADAIDSFEQAISLNAHLLAARANARALKVGRGFASLRRGGQLLPFHVVAGFVLGEILGVLAVGWLVALGSVLLRVGDAGTLPARARAPPRSRCPGSSRRPAAAGHRSRTCRGRTSRLRQLSAAHPPQRPSMSTGHSGGRARLGRARLVLRGAQPRDGDRNWRRVVLPLPSCPSAFGPQHSTRPGRVVAQVWAFAATAVTPLLRPATWTGVTEVGRRQRRVSPR